MADDGGKGGVLGAIERGIDAVFAPLTEWSAKIIFVPIPLPGGNSIPFVVVWLVVAAVIISFYLGFIQFRGFRTSLEVVRGKFSRSDDPGEVPHFQALTSAVSGTVGLGNIAGVGAAVALGGPGATFWMILAGLLGMATKFVECTLGVKYREVHEDGTVSGGPFKYLPVAFSRFPGFVAKGLTGLFAIAILFFGVAGGTMFQSNQTFAQARNTFGGADGLLGTDGAALVFGIVLSIGVGIVIIGGMRSIGAVTSRLVPFMGIIYVAACLLVIGKNITHVPDAFSQIVEGAFSPTGVSGGVIGVLIIGFQRAAFSNEAGLGSAAIAHSTVKTRRPVSEGFVASLEPFIDTVVICTMTALTIIIASDDSYLQVRQEVGAEKGLNTDGVTLTSNAFETFLPWFPWILTLAVLLFAFSTVITWSYYGLKAWHYLFGRSAVGDKIFYSIVCAFVVIGAVLTFKNVLDFADAFLFVCAFINLLGLYLLMPVVKKEMKEYLADRKSGRLYELGAEDDAELAQVREDQGNTGELPTMEGEQLRYDTEDGPKQP